MAKLQIKPDDLKRTIESNFLSLHFQPQVRVASGALEGVEAFVRWPHPIYGMLGPSEIIPLVEKGKMHAEFDRWVIRAACAQLVKWRAQGVTVALVATNIWGRTLQRPDAVDVVYRGLAETGKGLIPGSLVFEQLSDKLAVTFERLRGRARVTEADLDEALRDVRVALLEADVNLKVVRQLIATVRERALGAKVLESVTGAQQVVKIVHDALVEMLGVAASPLARADRPPTVIVLAGLQGSGKTTTAAKLANALRKQGRQPLLVAADVHRPAAIEQLMTLGKQLGVPVKAVDASRVAEDAASIAASAASEGATPSSWAPRGGSTSTKR